MGVEIRWGSARIVGPHQVAVTGFDGTTSVISARFILLCTGGTPLVPDIAGLNDVGFLTTDTFFDVEEVPRRIVFLGGGPVSVELAQACARLQISVTLLETAPRLLAREEGELVAALTAVLERDGVEVVTSVRIDRVEPGPIVIGTVAGAQRSWSTDAVVVVTGRRVETESLGLRAVGVGADGNGVIVDGRGRTAVPSIYAAGDVTGRDLFTHAAAHQAVTAVRDAFFPGRAPMGALVPWTTFTDPELAHAGMTVDEATAEFGRRHARVHRWSLTHNDRARTDIGEGSIVLVERVRFGRRRIVGAHVLCSHAGELIGELVIAIDRRMSVSDLGGLIHVYPTIATSIQQLGGRAAVEQALKYRWLMKLGGRRWR
jgi:pyruvate/2-oxoglutarate dehydrogenase complex dihydrolipoamide dehydrogenase (E3) component